MDRFAHYHGIAIAFTTTIQFLAQNLHVLSVASNCRVLGGSVAGLLTAASPVQIVCGSLNTEGKEPPKCSITVRPITEQPAVQRHDEPERVIRLPTETAVQQRR